MTGRAVVPVPTAEKVVGTITGPQPPAPPHAIQTHTSYASKMRCGFDLVQVVWPRGNARTLPSLRMTCAVGSPRKVEQLAFLRLNAALIREVKTFDSEMAAIEGI